MEIHNILFPKSIAVIGASSNTKKIGNTLSKNILKYGFKGKLYLINPKSKKILGKRVYKKISELPMPPDLAVICIPSASAVFVLEECARSRVKSAIIISAGFSEIGEAGKVLEKKIFEISRRFKMPVLGPNCLGVINSENRLNGSFASGMILPGKIALLSQSGALCSAVLDWAQEKKVGFSKVVSLGNKTVLDEIPFLEYFENDKNTHAVFAYLEGVVRGREFMKRANSLSFKKPFIILKSGKTGQGASAAHSHTGTLAGDEKIFSEAMNASGVILADSLQEFFDLMFFFSRYSLPQNLKIAVISNAGGPAVLTADSIEENGLEFSELKEETKKSLRAALPPAASVANPIDIVGDADARRYKTALNYTVKDPSVGVILTLLTAQTVTEVKETARVIAGFSKKNKKPILSVFLGGKKISDGVFTLKKNHALAYNFPEEAVSVIKKIDTFYKNQARTDIQNISSYKKITIDLKQFEFFRNLFRNAREEGFQQILAHETLDLLKSYEIPTVRSVRVQGAQDLPRALKDLQMPLAAKIISRDIVHKSDIGGVALNIQSIESAKIAYENIIKNAQKKFPKAGIDSVLFQEMADEGVELIIGAKRDPQFGPVVLLGAGGIYTEVFKDVSVKFVPVSKTQALRMIEELKLYPVLHGIRAALGYDVEAVVDVILKVSQLMHDFEGIKEIDLNPCVVFEKGRGIKAVDFRIMV